MTHYVMIDEYSGYVWGETDAADPVEACRLIDVEINGETGRSYEQHGSGWRFNGASGYHVHEAADGWVPVENGQDEAEIERASALPCVARVEITDFGTES